MDDNKKIELVKQIKKAFKDVAFPGRKIGEKEDLIDFLGKSWQEVSIDAINQNFSFLFFNTYGLKYYLQAYLIAILEYPDQVNSLVKDAVLRELGHKPISKDLCQLFSKRQKQALLEFFENYEDLLPIPIHNDFTKAQYAQAKKKADELHSKLEEAIRYWRSCM